MSMAENVISLNAWKGMVQLSRQGPKKTVTNLMLHMRNIDTLGPLLAFNDLSGNIEWRGRELRDSDYVDIRMELERHDYEANAKDVPACVLRAAEDRLYNPVTNYLNSLEWDRKERIDRFLPMIFGAEDTAIHRAFGRMFLIAAAARALQPGCQVDSMLILEGEQGIRKSTAVAELFGSDYVTGSLNTFKGPDAGQALQGVWAVDLGELTALGDASLRLIKNFVTLRLDRYRPPWGRHFINRPRRIVFIGSTNEQTFLNDPTGARRFWPVHVRKADIAALRTHRDQIWAEAVHLFRAGEQWWIEKGTELDTSARTLQDERYVEDVWAPHIDMFLEQPETKSRGCVLAAEVLTSLAMTRDRFDDRGEARVTSHLKHRGWFKHRCLRHGYNLNWWFPPGTEIPQKIGRPRA